MYNFTCKIQNCYGNVLCVSVPRWRQGYVRNEDVRALKDTLENLNTWKSTQRRTLMGILRKSSGNHELKPKTKQVKNPQSWTLFGTHHINNYIITWYTHEIRKQYHLFFVQILIISISPTTIWLHFLTFSLDREEKSLHHIALVAEFLDDDKPKMSLKKWIHTVSNFIDPIKFHLICQVLAKFSGVESKRTILN